MKSFRVKIGANVMNCIPHANGWAFVHRDDTGARKWVYAKTQAAIRARAEAHLAGLGDVDRLPAGRREFLLAVHKLVPKGQEEKVLEYLRGRESSLTVGAVIDRFAAMMAVKDRNSDYVDQVVRDCRSVVRDASMAMMDIGEAMLREWYEARVAGKGNARRRAVRAALVQLWSYARKIGTVPNVAHHVADMLPESAVESGSLHILTREELEKLLAVVPVEYRAWVLLGAWAGIRPEEISPKASKRAKRGRGIAWEDIDFEFKVIRVADVTSKVGVRRIVPMCPALLAALEPLRGIGPVCINPPYRKGLTKAWGAVLDGGKWEADALRHSYGSYRNGVLRDLSRVAEEMGTSVAMLNKHYHNPVLAESGAAWFEFIPQKDNSKAVSHSV